MNIKCQNCTSEFSGTFKYCPKCGNTLPEIDTNPSKQANQACNQVNQPRACDAFEKFKAKKTGYVQHSFEQKQKIQVKKVHVKMWQSILDL